jgi:hypothetical protein
MAKNNILFLLTMTLIVYSLDQRASAQQIDTRCKRFQELLLQEGVSLATYTPDGLQIVGQALEPIVSIKNSSLRSLEVPDITKASGVYVDTSHPAINHRSVNHQRWKDIDFCSFETIVLAAGETKEFLLAVDKKSFTEVDVTEQPAWIPRASKEPGKHRYIVDLGRQWISGEYTSSEVEVEDYVCFAKRGATSNTIAKGTANDTKQFCQIAAIVRLESQVFLLTGSAAVDLKLFAVWRDELMRIQEKRRQDSFLASLAPIRILALDESVRFSGAKIQDLIPIEKFGLLTAGGKTIQLQEVKERQAEQAYARSHRK